MRVTTAASLLFTIACLALHAVTASAAVTIALDRVDNGAPPKTMTMYLDVDKLRMNMDPDDFIYRGDQDKIWVLKPKSKSYLEITRETLNRASSAMQGAMAAMKDRLAMLPEAQRRQVEAMIAARGGGALDAAPPPPKFEKAGADRRVGDWTCTPFRVVLKGKASTEMCVAKLADLGLTPDDIKPFESLGGFVSKLRGPLSSRIPAGAFDYDAMRKAIGFDGFPVETTTDLGGGKHVFVTTVESIGHGDLPAGLFDLPDGFAKQDMGAMFGGKPAKP